MRLALHLLAAVGVALLAGLPTPLGVLGALAAVHVAIRGIGLFSAVPRSYARRWEHGVAFVGWFAWEVILASVDVARVLLTPRAGPAPAIVRVPLARAGDSFATLVGVLLSLTPGTLAVEYDREASALHVHALDARAAGQVEASVRAIERRLLAWLEGGELEGEEGR